MAIETPQHVAIIRISTLANLADTEAAGLMEHSAIVHVTEDDSVREWRPATSSWTRTGGKFTSVDPSLKMTGGVLRIGGTAVEVNLGSVPRHSGSFDITGLTGLTVDTNVVFRQASGPYTGKGTLADESEMDQVTAVGSAINATTIRAYWIATGSVTGNFKFVYRIGT